MSIQTSTHSLRWVSSLFATCVVLIAPPASAVSQASEARAMRLLRHWAPTFVQHVAPGDDGRDRPLRVDFDGDWVLSNNWDNQTGDDVDAGAYVYGAAVLSNQYAYLSYHLFYPRDWTRPVCLPYVCHENDFESVLLVVSLRGRSETGRIELIETKTHKDYLTLRGSEIALDAQGSPLVWSEARGHGLRACRNQDRACRRDARRIVYELGEQAGIAADEPRGESVPYVLLSVRETLWRHRRAVGARAGERWVLNADDGPQSYVSAALGRIGAPLGMLMASSRFGAAARPPWGLKASRGGRGDWFFDPARVIAASHGLKDDGGSYIYNPYVDDLRGECQGAACEPFDVQIPRHKEPQPVRGGIPVFMAAMFGLLARTNRGVQRSLRRLSE